MGIDVRFANPGEPDSFRALSDEKTRAYFGETLPNPKFVPFPIEEVASIGWVLGIPLIVDNTAAPITCRPFDLGAAIVVHSLTKYIGGHGTSIGCIIIDSGVSIGLPILVSNHILTRLIAAIMVQYGVNWFLKFLVHR